MKIKAIKNIEVPGLHGRPIPTDIFYSETGTASPVVLFCHGYKGFKDWGPWNLMAEEFVKKGYAFVKFNFAFNGGTLEEPVDFPDLEAFGANTYTKELDDLEVLISWITAKEFEFAEVADGSRLTLMGHSRGGGIVVIKAAEDRRVKKLISLAAVSDFGSRFPKGKELEDWRQRGIAYIENSRTKQQMPHLFDFYEDFKQNEERFTISRAAKKLSVPFLICHGTNDPTVDVDNAYDLNRWAENSELFIVEQADHVFGASHPWTTSDLPSDLELVIRKCLDFISDQP